MSEADQVRLCSAALLEIGHTPIASFDEGTIEADLAGLWYPLSVDGLLSLHPWNFAQRQKRLIPTTETPEADFDYRFKLPSDTARTLSIGSEIEKRGRGAEMRRVDARHFDCNVDSVVVTYVSRPDEQWFEPYFDLALVARLEAAFMLAVTGDRGAWLAAKQAAREQFAESRTADGQQSTPVALEGFPLVDVR